MIKAILLLLAAVSTGCSANAATDERVCTLIGCSSGLNIAIEGAADGPFRIEATDGSTMQEFDCPAGARCERVTFDDFLPESVTVRVIAAGDTAITTSRPTYTTLQPNGPGCPPSCRQATVTARKP